MLPLHWQAVTLLLGVVATGAVPVVVAAPGAPAAGLEGCGAIFTTVDAARAALAAGADDVLAVSTAPMGGRLPDLPAALLRAGVLDAGRELPVHGDHYSGPDPRGWRAEVAGRAVGSLPDLGLSASDRVLTVLAPGTYDGLVVGLLAPLSAGAAVVLLPGPVDAATVGLAASQERATAVVGIDVPGVRRLPSAG